VLDFVMQYKEIGAKEAALWLLSLVDNRGGQESVQVKGSSNGAGQGEQDAGVRIPEVQAKAALGAEHAAVSGNGKLQLTEREEWLGIVIYGPACNVKGS
jgi:hypothetical protein